MAYCQYKNLHTYTCTCTMLKLQQTFPKLSRGLFNSISHLQDQNAGHLNFIKNYKRKGPIKVKLSAQDLKTKPLVGLKVL